MDLLKQNWKIIAIVLSVFAFMFIVAVLISSDGEDFEEPRYELNEETGREFFVDPEQAVETAEIDTITLFKAEELINYIYGDYYSQLTIKMTKYLWDDVSEDIVFAYVDSSVSRNAEQEIVFDFITNDPVESRHRAKIFINFDDRVDTTFTPL